MDTDGQSSLIGASRVSVRGCAPSLRESVGVKVPGEGSKRVLADDQENSGLDHGKLHT